jgi:predicted DNA-binding transcriptional regulator YafY
MNRVDRMLATILLLQSRRVIKAEDIAEHFEISLRTVYRDMAALSEAGVPVAAEAGVGYSLLRGYLMPPVMFTAEEASALFLGGELVEHLTDPSLQAEVRSALLKIRSVLPRPQQDHVDRLESSTALFIRPRRGQGQPPAGAREVLTRIQNALAQRRVLALSYATRGRDEVTRRDVEPLGLVFYSDYWHLIAYCRWRREVRDFRTDRIVELAVRASTFLPRGDFSLREYISGWGAPSDTLAVRVRFALRAAERARRSWFGGPREEEADANGVVMSFAVSSLDWIGGWLLSFGTEAEVIEPAELRVSMAAQAAALARHHGGPAFRTDPALPESLLT